MYMYIERETIKECVSVYYCELRRGVPYCEHSDPPPFKWEEVNLSFLNCLKKKEVINFPIKRKGFVAQREKGCS